MEEIVEAIKLLREALGEGYAPYVALYLIYKYLLKPVEEAFERYINLKARQVSTIEKILAEAEKLSSACTDKFR